MKNFLSKLFSMPRQFPTPILDVESSDYLNTLFERLYLCSRRSHNDLLYRQVKLSEETGELAEAVLHVEGFSPHKKMKEPIEGEVADVVICALDILMEAYPEDSVEESKERLFKALDLKSLKWVKIVEAQ